MNFGGLIANALKGASTAYTDVAKQNLDRQNRIDLEKELIEINIERDRRIKEADLNRDRGEEARKLSPEYLHQQADAEKLRAQLGLENQRALAPAAADTEVVVGGEKARARGALAPANAAADSAEFDAGRGLARQKAVAEGENTAAGLIAEVRSPGALDAMTDKANATAGPAQRAAANVSNFEVTQAKELLELRKQLARLPLNDPRRAALEQELNARAPTTPKSLSDVVAMGRAYAQMAEDNYKMLNDPVASATLPDEERARLLREAQEYRQAAQEIFQSVGAARLPGTGAGAVPKDAPPEAAQSSTYKEGDRVRLKNGGTGVVVRKPDGTLAIQAQ